MRWVRSPDARSPGVRSGDVWTGDVRLAVVEEGDPDDPTIVLVHGYPDTHRVWDEVAARLRDRFHVVRYDVRGAGASSAPRGRDHYHLDRLTADLAAVLEAVGKPRVHLVGHDWGAIQGWDAVARPGLRERVASFTCFGGPGPGQFGHFLRHGRRREVAAQLARSWYIGVFQLPVLPELAWRTVLPWVFERTLRFAEGLEPRPGHPAATLREDAAHGVQLYRANTLTGRPAAEPYVDVPVQLVECRRDPFVTPALLRSQVRGVTRLWHRRADAGHWAQRGAPDLIARMIGEFAEHIEGGEAARSLRGAKVAQGRKAFADRLVVVTGAGSGIGRATARAFAAHGAEVICADLDAEAARRAADDIAEDLGGTAHAAHLDVADAARMEAFAGDVRSRYGVPDIVVNNAGNVVAGGFLDHTLEDWHRAVDVNLWGVIHGCRLFAAQMVERGEGGHIVNIASLGAFTPSRALPAYSVAKAGVKMLSDCLRAELAGHGIGVSAICPGFVSTSIARNATYVGTASRKLSEEAVRRRGYPPERVAAHILRAVHRNEAVVPVNLEGKIGYALSRISPTVARGLARLAAFPGNPRIPR
ncbi:SDR family oxidoreductase [Nonomuraea sp. ZG12]|uniref:SDR family oxidoreductase n=1 Tax=Nonomuraea sp. ZG12 TaxID=3452207 RepID=UPI003F8AC57A